MKALIKIKTLPKILLATLALACGCTSNPSTSDSAGNAVPRNPDGMALVRGTVINVSSKQIALQTKDNTQTVLLADSLHLYTKTSSSLAAVKNTSFIGVTTQKQADGSDQATEIHLFPEELRGLGEGSFMMDAQTGSNNRMTNGTASRMTNGVASRMTNGDVLQAGKFSLVVQYQGQSRTVKVPANIPVTTYTLTNKKLSPGDKVVALVKKEASGHYRTAKVLISGK
jgi:hypothetical protein